MLYRQQTRELRVDLNDELGKTASNHIAVAEDG